jgi:hypothetical protein
MLWDLPAPCWFIHPKLPTSPSQELRAAADAEAAALKARLPEGVARDEILAARIKAEFWDPLEVGLAVAQLMRPVVHDT